MVIAFEVGILFVCYYRTNNL